MALQIPGLPKVRAAAGARVSRAFGVTKKRAQHMLNISFRREIRSKTMSSPGLHFSLQVLVPVARMGPAVQRAPRGSIAPGHPRASQQSGSPPILKKGRAHIYFQIAAELSAMFYSLVGSDWLSMSKSSVNCIEGTPIPGIASY